MNFSVFSWQNYKISEALFPLLGKLFHTFTKTLNTPINPRHPKFHNIPILIIILLFRRVKRKLTNGLTGQAGGHGSSLIVPKKEYYNLCVFESWWQSDYEKVSIQQTTNNPQHPSFISNRQCNRGGGALGRVWPCIL